MARGRFDALRLDLADGERVHVFGRPELYEQRGEFKLRALTIERFGVGAHLASLERLKATLAAEGLFADARKRPLPYLPRRIGIVTGNDAAAKRDVVTTIRSRFPPASVLVAETYVQGPRAAAEIVAAIGVSASTRTSTSSSSPAAAAASRICSPSATNVSSGRSPSAPSPWSPLSGTSRTRRSATSRRTSGPRPRRLRESSSCRS